MINAKFKVKINNYTNYNNIIIKNREKKKKKNKCFNIMINY